MTTIRGVLLDMDGTLIDSNDAHARSWVEAFTRGGHSVSFERVRKMIGMGQRSTDS
jgi:beta-phosphoglucomutase-like phosphatase (HAD superfamily)